MPMMIFHWAVFGALHTDSTACFMGSVQWVGVSQSQVVVPNSSTRRRRRAGNHEGAAVLRMSKMAALVELCCVDSFPPHLSPLDVLILNSDLGSVLQNDSDPPTLLFTPQRPRGSGRPDILLRVHPSTEEETCGGGTSPRPESGRRVRLFTSRLFMRHHGLQRLGSTGTVRPLKPVSLDRVVLGARSRQSLRWAGTEQFTGELLELCRPGQWLLARQGDPLLLPRHPVLGRDPGQNRGQDPGQVSLRDVCLSPTVSLTLNHLNETCLFRVCPATDQMFGSAAGNI